MEKVRVAVNGFGRIGRLTARVLLQNPAVELVAINDLSNAETMGHLFKYDSLHGKFEGRVEVKENTLEVNDKMIYLYGSKDPESLPWNDLKIDVVLECTGIFRKPEDAGKHITAGAKKVIISAPPKGKGIKQIVLGINDDSITAEDKIISNASCTTNCAAPLITLMDQNFGIQKGILTTVHAYTSDQRIHDAPHRDLRRARAAAANIIPTSTGASSALEAIFPKLAGKLMGSAIRVPTSTGSITELTLVLDKLVSKQEVNEVFEKASQDRFNGILEYNTDPIVSSDIVGNAHSSIFDSDLTVAMGSLVKISSWYDNEIGYSNRLAELAEIFGRIN